jgi:hypothetical protein
MTEAITESEKQRIFQFVDELELDYDIIDNGITKPALEAADGVRFHFHKNGDEYVIAKYDKEKDRPGTSGAYQFYQFKSLQQIMEQLKIYDEAIPKTYWAPTANSIDFPFDKDSYEESWHEWIEKDESYSIEEDAHCQYLSYSNDGYSPEIKSPFNTVGEDAWGSILHESNPTKVERLHFEIYPLCGRPKRERYMVKILCNNEEVLKEYVTYTAYRKKGLRLLLQSIFSEAEKFKKKNNPK